VPFEGVALDHRGMAAAELVGNSMTAADGARVVYLDWLHPEAAGAQVLDPRAAAASVGVQVDADFRR
jgi:hypothetical protein